jgi:hypothetical protein
MMTPDTDLILDREEREILRAAAGEMKKRGIFYGMGSDPVGPIESCPVCILGAVAYVRLGHPDRWSGLVVEAPRLVKAIAGAIHNDPPYDYAAAACRDVIAWNDKSRPPTEAAVDVLLRAAGASAL